MLMASVVLALVALVPLGLAVVGTVRLPARNRVHATVEDEQWAAELHALNDAMTRLHKHRAKVARREARTKP